tara:strand:+ start:4046 stop:4873 length:828 start_codon:yes stop_codon:yes gene_type:complete
MKSNEQIVNPATGRKVSIHGRTGQKILNSYLENEQNAGDPTPHMGARQRRRAQRLTDTVRATSRRQLRNDRSVAIQSASAHGHEEDSVEHPHVSSVSLNILKPIAANIRPKAAGTAAQRARGIRRGDAIGPFFPVELDSERLATIMQKNVTNRTKDQITFLSGEGEVSQEERDDFEEALKYGDGSGLIDFPNLKLLFRGVLYDFMMRNGKIVFQIQKSRSVHSRCQTRGSRRLDGVIHYKKAQNGRIILEKVALEKGTCWPKKLPAADPVAKVSL